MGEIKSESVCQNGQEKQCPTKKPTTRLCFILPIFYRFCWFLGDSNGTDFHMSDVDLADKPATYRWSFVGKKILGNPN